MTRTRRRHSTHSTRGARHANRTVVVAVHSSAVRLFVTPSQLTRRTECTVQRHPTRARMRVQRINVHNAQLSHRPANINRIVDKQKQEKTKSMWCCGRQRLDACAHKSVNVQPRCCHLSNPLPRAGHPARIARILAAGRRRSAAAAPTRRAGTCARGAARWAVRCAADADARSRWWRQRYRRWWAPPFGRPAAAVAADKLALLDRRHRRQPGGR